jgi:tartrate dehydrogenase/decarboxylase/D-malate dehydrogenase
MLLEHLGEFDAANRLMSAIEQVTANPALHTGDLSGKATTAQVTQAVCGLLGVDQQCLVAAK